MGSKSWESTFQTPPLVTAIVLNWNGGEQIIASLSSLVKSDGVSPAIVVVDNGSTDGSICMIRQQFPEVDIIENGFNAGVARGWNIGIERAREIGSPFFLLLNSDAKLDPGCLSRLTATMSGTPDAAMVTPRIVDVIRAGRLWFDGGTTNRFGVPVHRNFGKPPSSPNDPFEQTFATGCVVLIRKSALEDVGGFDERFFAYSEDADLSIRARARGWKLIHDPQALAHHAPSSAVVRNRGKWFRDYYVTRNKLFLLRRQMQGWRWFRFLLYFWIKDVVAPVGYFILTAQFKRIGAIGLAVVDFFRHRFGERYL